ncbi:Uncharacterized protein FKW44_017946 [Caligus rogercresseyi]|uniref:Uncharacterized protein n=1 Tax=Caligus rogercresseyi TaxID=217165 RepID=A0A7T8GU39_CALRO|nr:Uncharacterized protein FKW44_017946 [Caligus rogercresseyi]
MRAQFFLHAARKNLPEKQNGKSSTQQPCLPIHTRRNNQGLDVQKIIDSFALNHKNRRIVLHGT